MCEFNFKMPQCAYQMFWVNDLQSEAKSATLVVKDYTC